MIYIRENAFENVCGRHTGRDDKTDEDNLPHYDDHYDDVIMTHAGVSNHQPRDCLLNSLFRRRSNKISKLRVTGLCAEN